MEARSFKTSIKQHFPVELVGERWNSFPQFLVFTIENAKIFVGSKKVLAGKIHGRSVPVYLGYIYLLL